METLSTLLEECRARNMAASTIKAYRRTWIQFFAWTTAEGYDVSGLPPAAAKAYAQDALQGRGVSSAMQFHAGMSFLYGHLKAANPFAGMGPGTPLRPPIRPPEAATLAKLLSHLSAARSDYFGHLVYHLALCIGFTGIRRIASLRLCDLRRAEGGLVTHLNVSGRWVPCAPAVSETLSEWLSFLERIKGARLRRGDRTALAFIGSPLVFPGKSGSEPSNNSINRRLAAACAAAQISALTTNTLRHAAAAQVLASGKSLKSLQATIGHASLSTTRRYARRLQAQ
jgi:site-specific recombinase XerD